MTFESYCKQVAVEYSAHPDWRYGQTYFNVLAEVRPDIAETIRRSEIDPFHNDKLIPLFLHEVFDRW